jgi:hypothetical protein
MSHERRIAPEAFFTLILKLLDFPGTALSINLFDWNLALKSPGTGSGGISFPGKPSFNGRWLFPTYTVCLLPVASETENASREEDDAIQHSQGGGGAACVVKYHVLDQLLVPAVFVAFALQ